MNTAARRVGSVLLLATGLCGGVHAQSGARMDRPFVVEVGFGIRRGNAREQDLNVNRVITLSGDERIVISALPLDQNGRRFPLDRFRLDVDPSAECRGRVDVSEGSAGELRVRAGSSRGRCEVEMWVPGNLNLEYTLTFEVGGLGLTNYSRPQAVAIVNRLYRAVLQRDPDAPSLPLAVAEVQRGSLQGQVEGLVQSAEFRELRQQTDPVGLLTAFFRGMFDREPDTAGVRGYLGEIERGRYAQVLMSLAQSEEFERKLPR